MSTELSLFDFNGHQVRIFPSDDGLSFYAVAKDATDILGYATAKDGLRRVPDAHKGRRSVPTLGGTQEMLCVDKPGLYRLVLRSDKPEAEPFMEWLTSQVLPSIRKTGGFFALPQGPITLAELARHEAALKQAQDALAAVPVILNGDERRLLGTSLQRLHWLAGEQAREECQDLIVEMEAAGKTRRQIADATGKSFSYIRQIVFLARRDGLLPAAQTPEQGDAQ